MTVFLNGLGTAVPPYELPQDLVLQNARKILGPRYKQFERMAATFTTSGVETRYSVAPLEWFQEEKNWPQRNQLYLDGATRLFIEAARAALDEAGLTAADIGTVVTVSSTGVATPTLEAMAWKEIGFSPDVRRVPLFGLGCAGGVTGMATAADLARSRPGTHVLMVALEACTLSFRSDRLQKADIIATVLFGDGAAAAVLSTEDTGNATRIGTGSEHLWCDTLDIMGWDVDETGFGVVFDRSIPTFAEEYFQPAAAKALCDAGLSQDTIDRFVCHPGGAKVVHALENAMALEEGTLDVERSVLKDYGNMSAPTVLFVLKRVLEDGARGQFMMTALGPGFTASFLPVSTA